MKQRPFVGLTCGCGGQRDWWALGEAQRKEQADAESSQAQPGQEASADGPAPPVQ